MQRVKHAFSCRKPTDHDDEDVRRSVDDLVESDDMRMAAHLENMNLPPNLVHDVEALDAALTDDLHRHLLVCQSVLGDCSGSFRFTGGS